MQGAIKADLKRGSATQAINELSIARAGGEEAGASSRPSPGGEGDGTGVKARKSEKVMTSGQLAVTHQENAVVWGPVQTDGTVIVELLSIVCRSCAEALCLALGKALEQTLLWRPQCC